MGISALLRTVCGMGGILADFRSGRMVVWGGVSGGGGGGDPDMTPDQGERGQEKSEFDVRKN